MDLAAAAWRKSSRSGSNGCVEIAFLDGQIAVRDSKDRSGPVLQFTHREWEAFLAEQRDLGPKQRPRFVRIMDELPRTATNKVLKRELKTEALGDQGTLWTRVERGTSYDVT